MPNKTTTKDLVPRNRDYQNLLDELKSIIAKRKAAHPGNSVSFTMNSKLMKMIIRPSHGNLEDVVEIGDRAVAANQ